jgi:hypothetical protein
MWIVSSVAYVAKSSLDNIAEVVVGVRVHALFVIHVLGWNA